MIWIAQIYCGNGLIRQDVEAESNAAASEEERMAGSSESVMSTNRRWLIGLCVLILWTAGKPCHAQAVPTPMDGNAAPANAGTLPSSNGVLIRSGDTVAVTVFDAPELSVNVRVSGDGTVKLPLLPDVKIAGLSEASAARIIDTEYISRGFLLRPATSVLIHDFAVKGVSILGEVTRPGIYPIAGARSIVDVIALAGGLTVAADTRLIIRRTSGLVEVVTISLPLDDGAKTLGNDVEIFPGDRVVAQRAGTVYVLGDVGRPGGYVMQHNGMLTVLQAVAWASGTTRTSGENSAVLIRRSGETYTTSHLALRDMYKGKIADITLKPDDVIYVPSSNLRNFVVSAPQILGSLAGAAIYSVNR
jgi:polysaccharide biosynthesis/export protein